jgi:hypothetical protein
MIGSPGKGGVEIAVVFGTRRVNRRLRRPVHPLLRPPLRRFAQYHIPARRRELDSTADFFSQFGSAGIV